MLAWAALACGCAFAAPLTLNECLDTAMANNPELKAAQETIASERAGVLQAVSVGRTQVSASAGYTRGGTGLSSQNNDGSYTGSLEVSQQLSDWGRLDANIEGAKLSEEAASADYMSTREDIIQDVCTAYYGLNRAVRDNEIAQTRYDNYAKRLDWAKSYYEVGTKAKIEVTKAEADLAASKLDVVESKADIEECRAELANAMGVPTLDVDAAQDMLEYEEWGVTFDDAVKRALEERSELTAKRKRVEYAQTNLTVQMKGLSPSLSASAGYDVYGPSVFDTGEWSARLSLDLPIWDGGLTKGKIEEAEAELRVAQAELQSLSDSVVLEVRKACLALDEAKEALVSSREAERSAKETLDLALGRYSAGVGDNLEISDAVESYASACESRVLALYNCKTARLDLEKAMGGLKYGE